MTPTQGEHAQTEALPVSDALRTLHEAILNRLSHAELLEKAHYLMELNSNQARTIGELQDLVEAATAQPATLPAADVDLIARGMRWEDCEALMKEACAQAGVQWDDEKEPQSIAINVMMRLANAAHKAGFKLGLERMAAASHGQAPAGAAWSDMGQWLKEFTQHMSEHADHTDQSFYRGLVRLTERAHKLLAIAITQPFPTAQAAPAAGAVAVPRETLVAWRQWCAQSMSHAIEHEISDWLAAAPTPAAQADSQPAPIDMVLHCPSCFLQHIDAPDERTPDWKNEPHRSHLCHGCGHIWRPSDVPTNGVAAVKTTGKADSPIAACAPADSVPKAQFDDPKVQAVYDILCDDTDWPPKENPQQHWEGWIARRIVDALLADSVLEDAAMLDWIQHNGATVEVMPWQSGYGWRFRVAGLHATTSNNIRESIAAARKQGGA